MEDLFNELNERRKVVEDNIAKSLGVDIEKARSGVYADTAENRKLQRVGQQYGEKKEEATSEKKGSSKNEELTEDDKKEVLNILKHKSPNNNDSPRHLEQMSDSALDHFIKEAREYAGSYGLNKSTREACKKWADLGESEKKDRRKKAESSKEKGSENSKTLSLSDFKIGEPRNTVKEALKQAKSDNRPYFAGSDSDNQFYTVDAIDYPGWIEKRYVLATCYPDGTIKRGFVEIDEKEAEKYGAKKEFEDFSLKKESKPKLKKKSNTDNDEQKPAAQSTQPIMDAIAAFSSGYKDESKVAMRRTPKNNWEVFYDGHRLGVIDGSVVSESVAKEMDWISDDPRQHSKRTSESEKTAEFRDSDEE